MTKIVIDLPATPDSFRKQLAKELVGFLEHHHFSASLVDGLEEEDLGPVVLNFGRGAPAYLGPMTEPKYGYVIKMGKLSSKKDRPFDFWHVWGHFPTRAKAEDVVKRIWTDVYSEQSSISELVSCIFEVPEGFWFTRRETWYTLVRTSNGLEACSCDKPKGLPEGNLLL